MATTRKPKPRKMMPAWAERLLLARATTVLATAIAKSTSRFTKPIFLMFRSMISIQLPIFKQQKRQGERSAQVADDVTQGLPDIAPRNGFLVFQCVSEPEKLPVRYDGVKERGPPGTRFGPAAKEVIGHESQQEQSRADGQCRN